jgi:hypothetical protein
MQKTSQTPVESPKEQPVSRNSQPPKQQPTKTGSSQGNSEPPYSPPMLITTVYIQISKSDQEQQARKLQQSLNNAGFEAQEASDEIEQKTSTSQKLAIRYFHNSDLDAAKRAQAIASKIAGTEVSLESLVGSSEKQDLGTIEVWFPPQ